MLMVIDCAARRRSHLRGLFLVTAVCLLLSSSVDDGRGHEHKKTATVHCRVDRVEDGKIYPVSDAALVWDIRRNKAAPEVGADGPDDAPHQITITDGQISPRVSVMRAGQQLEIRADRAGHNVNIGFVSNAPFGPSLQLKPPLIYQRVVGKAERAPVEIRCDIHPLERAWLIVQAHSFIGVAGPDGTMSIKGLPAGPNWFRIWHPDPATQISSVKINGKTAHLRRSFLKVTLSEGKNELLIRHFGKKGQEVSHNSYNQIMEVDPRCLDNQGE